MSPPSLAKEPLEKCLLKHDRRTDGQRILYTQISSIQRTLNNNLATSVIDLRAKLIVSFKGSFTYKGMDLVYITNRFKPGVSFKLFSGPLFPFF